MSNYYYMIQPDARFIAHPSPTAPDTGAIAGSFLVLFFLFIVFASLLKRSAQEEAQVESDRQQLERSWEASQSIQHSIDTLADRKRLERIWNAKPDSNH